jgi:hypothetical protein
MLIYVMSGMSAIFLCSSLANYCPSSDANTSFRVRSWTLCHSSELNPESVIQVYHLEFASVAFLDLDSYVHERRGVSFWLRYVTPFDSW